MMIFNNARSAIEFANKASNSYCPARMSTPIMIHGTKYTPCTMHIEGANSISSNIWANKNSDQFIVISRKEYNNYRI